MMQNVTLSVNDALLSRLYERDIDVLLQEDLIFSEPLCQLVSRSLNFHEQLRVTQCRLSVVNSTGETDLFAYLDLTERAGILLIENKIDVKFQPRQPERYQERAKALAVELRHDSIFTMLIAPSRYVEKHDPQSKTFDCVLSYEQVAMAIESEGTPRSRYRAALLRRAITQAGSSYILTPAPQVSDFWTRVFQIARNEHPELEMLQPKEKGAQSKWIIFKPGLLNRVTIDWKITQGTVDLSFWPNALLHPITASMLSGFPQGAALGTAGRTVVIRMRVARPPQDWITMTDDQIREALAAASELLAAFRANKRHFQ